MYVGKETLIRLPVDHHVCHVRMRHTSTSLKVCFLVTNLDKFSFFVLALNTTFKTFLKSNKVSPPFTLFQHHSEGAVAHGVLLGVGRNNIIYNTSKVMVLVKSQRPIKVRNSVHTSGFSCPVCLEPVCRRGSKWPYILHTIQLEDLIDYLIGTSSGRR